MLTPKDIHEVEFSRVLKGYNPREVDAFLRKIVVEYEGILQENDDLQAQMRVLEEKVYEAAALQKGIRDALAKANELVERRRVEAEEEAERILQKSRHSVQVEEEHLRRIQEFGAGVKRRLRSLLMSNIALIDDEDESAGAARGPARVERPVPAPDVESTYEKEIESDPSLEETRVFTLPPGMRQREERETDFDQSLRAVENGYDEAAVSDGAEGSPPYGETSYEPEYDSDYEESAYEPDDEYRGGSAETDDEEYDEERVLKERWARRVRQNRRDSRVDVETGD